MDESRARALLRTERTEVAALLRDTEEAARGRRQVTDIPGDFGDAGQPLSREAEDEAVAAQLRERLDAIDRALAGLRRAPTGGRCSAASRSPTSGSRRTRRPS